MAVVTPVELGCSLYEEDIAYSQSEVCIKDGIFSVFIETTLGRFRFFQEISHITVQDFNKIKLSARCTLLLLGCVGDG